MGSMYALARWLLSATLVAAFALACSSQSQRIEELSQSPEPGDDSASPPADTIRVLDSGFVWDRDTLSYAFTAENNSPDTSMEEVSVQVSVYDPTGQAIGSDTAIIDFILPGQVVAHAARIPLLVRPERISLSFTVERQPEVKSARAFERASGHFETTSFGGRVVTAIRNPYDTELRRLKVVAVLRTPDGRILNGGATMLEFLPATGESVVTVDILGTAPEPPDTVDVYTMFSAETVFRLE
jgi:hypothetical protein